jgi:hypothetical protein
MNNEVINVSTDLYTSTVATDWLATLILLIIGRTLAAKKPFEQPIKPFLGDPTVSFSMLDAESASRLA